MVETDESNRFQSSHEDEAYWRELHGKTGTEAFLNMLLQIADRYPPH
jgi:hypothetical protein